MALFGRKKNPTISEIESYYEQQNRRSNSSARAWGMALLAILFTVALVAILFFAGRWVYDQFSGTDSANDETISQEVNSGNVDLGGFDSDSDDNDSESSGADQTQDGVVSEEAATTDESNVDRVGVNDTEGTEDEDTSVNGTSTSLPNTGAGETAVIVSLITGMLAGIYSYRKKLSAK